jgi:oligo-1,6-glucosidase
MKRTWWKESVVYQIYPRSFCDSNGDGIGDLRGILQKLDYLQALGVNVVWLCPVYQSPNDDGGYDISDYRAILSEFGTLADWEDLLAEMHRRGLKLVMDLVVNHTSDEHAWFREARQSKDNPYRDYYIWRPGRSSEPGRSAGPGGQGADLMEPNNWVSFFRGSAWAYDDLTGEYYLHLFSRKQPDLNWENPRVRAEVFNLISKMPGLPDAPWSDPTSRYQWGGAGFANGPRLLEFLTEMKTEVLSHYDLFTVGETPMVTPAHAAALTNEETGPLNMVFQFEHMDLDVAPHDYTRLQHVPLQLRDLKRVMSRWQTELEGRGWNSLYLSNHDQARLVSRFGDDGRYRVESAKMLATFVHLQQGTPFIYQGDEIGMTNVKYEAITDYHDVETLNIYQELVQVKGLAPEKALDLIRDRSRDNARTPMQWTAQAQAGFTTGTPWIGVNSNYSEINVQQALADPNSIFYYYQQLIRLRKENPVMVYGRYELILEPHEQIYAFTRSLPDDRLLVVLNFSKDTPVFSLPPAIPSTGQALLISNYPGEAAEDLAQLTLRPYEARVYRLG